MKTDFIITNGNAANARTSIRGKGRWVVALLILSVYCLFRLHVPGFLRLPGYTEAFETDEIRISAPACPQATPIRPVKHSDLFSKLDKLFQTDSFKEAAYVSLGSAVQVP